MLLDSLPGISAFQASSPARRCAGAVGLPFNILAGRRIVVQPERANLTPTALLQGEGSQSKPPPSGRMVARALPASGRVAEGREGSVRQPQPHPHPLSYEERGPERASIDE